MANEFVPVETITLPMSVLPASVRTALSTAAKAKGNSTKQAKDNFETKIKQKSAAASAKAAGGPGGGAPVAHDAHTKAVQTEDPDLFRDYQAHHYALKMDPLLTNGGEGKVTLLRSLITPAIQAEIEAKLTEIEQDEGSSLHPWHAQARERLGKMTPWKP